MENSTILVILIIVIIFLYLNSKSNNVEHFNSSLCGLHEYYGGCRSTPYYMRNNCSDYCIEQKREFYYHLKNLSVVEERLLKDRQDLINSGQDPNIKNQDLQNIYKKARDLKTKFPVVDIDFDINLDPNYKGELKSSLVTIVEQLQKMYKL